MKTIPEQLASYFKANAGMWVASGEIQRLIWKNRNGSIAVPRSLVRRLQELCADGTLKEEIRGRHAYYTYAKEIKERKMVQMWTPDGRPYMREIFVDRCATLSTN